MLRLGIDMGGTSIKTGVVDGKEIIARHSVRTLGTFEQVVSDMARSAREAAAKAGVHLHDFASVGVGIPSAINPRTGRLVYSNNTDWRDVPFVEELNKHIPAKVLVDNDANCAAIGEAVAGGAAGVKNLIMITLGTGVGGAVILNGKLFSGADGMGTELGHVPLVLDGEACTCGIRGCYEAYASLSGLARLTRAAMELRPDSKMKDYLEGGQITGRTAFDAAKAGDQAALEVVDQYARYVAAGIGGLVTTFRPDTVLIGGGISHAGAFLLDRIRQGLPEFVYAADVIGCPSLAAALLGNDAGIIGAAYLDEMQSAI